MNIGQINFETGKLGQYLLHIAKDENIKTIIEVGTWNGLGSTRCILEGLKDRDINEYKFLSFECNPEMYSEAVKNNKEKLGNNFDIIFGKLVDEELLSSWFDVGILTDEQRGWLTQDYNWMKDISNVSEVIPEHIDFLVLDGGEYSTYLEWNLLKERFLYCALDDTMALKCNKIREEVLSQPNKYEIIDDNTQERNGYLVFKKLC